MDTTTAASLAIQLMANHGLTDWAFRWDYSTRRIGQCRYGPKEIGLSVKFTKLNPEEHVRDVILHEIAHALCPGHHHDGVWQAKCVEIGAKPNRLARDLPVIPTKLIAKCEVCLRQYCKTRVSPTARYWCHCQVPVPAESRKLLKFCANELAVPVTGHGETDLLIKRLQTATKQEAKSIRARLRRMGHKGGMRG